MAIPNSNFNCNIIIYGAYDDRPEMTKWHTAFNEIIIQMINEIEALYNVEYFAQTVSLNRIKMQNKITTDYQVCA